MEVRWALQASQDLAGIVRHIRQENPEMARQVAEALYAGCISLAQFPERGRPSRMRGRRELVFTSLPYIAVYRVKADAVEILHLYHDAQDWP